MNTNIKYVFLVISCIILAFTSGNSSWASNNKKNTHNAVKQHKLSKDQKQKLQRWNSLSPEKKKKLKERYNKLKKMPKNKQKKLLAIAKKLKKLTPKKRHKFLMMLKNKSHNSNDIKELKNKLHEMKKNKIYHDKVLKKGLTRKNDEINYSLLYQSISDDEKKAIDDFVNDYVKSLK